MRPLSPRAGARSRGFLGGQRSNPAPSVAGTPPSEKGRGIRCDGFLSSDGVYAHCAREQYSGNLDPHKGGRLYAHRLHGSCRCGVWHGGPASADVRRVTTVHANEPHQWRIPDSDVEMVHRYELAGIVQFEVCRIWKHARIKYPNAKCFPRHRGQDGRWYFGQGLKWIGRTDKPLYREDEALAELRLGGLVFIVEGERDADAFWDRGCVAVCNPDGAGSFRPAQAQRLSEAMFLSAPPMVGGEPVTNPEVLNGTSAEIIIIADDDPAGLRHATMIRETLTEVEPRLKDRVRSFVPPSGFKDAAEWLAREEA